MVFSTVESSITKSGQALSIFKKNWHDVIYDIQNTSGIANKVKAAFSTTISSTDLDAIKKYNAEIKNGVISQTAFNRCMLNTSSAAQNLVASANGATVSEEALTVATNQLTFAQKASATASKVMSTALNMAFNIGITIAINAMILGITKLINKEKEAEQAAEEARQKAVENAEAYQDEADSLKDLQSRYTELVASTNDITTIKEDLSSIQDEIVAKYGEEAEAIDLLNGKYSENIKLMKEQQLENAKEYEIENKANYDKAVNAINKYNSDKWFGNSNYRKTGFSNNVKDAWIEAGIGVYYGRDFDKNQPGVYLSDSKISISGTLQEQYDILTKMIEIYGEQENYNKENYNLLVNEASVIKEQLDNYNQIISQYEEIQKVIRNLEVSEETKNEFYTLLDNAIEAYNTLNSADANTAQIGEAWNALNDLEIKLRALAGNNTELLTIIDDTFAAFENGASTATTSLSAMSQKFSNNFDEVFKTASDNISKIEAAMQTLAEGNGINTNDAWEIMDLDENQLLGIPRIIDGEYVFQMENLIRLKNELIKTTKEQYEIEITDAKKAIENAERQIEIEQAVLESKRRSINSPGDIAETEKYLEKIASLKSEISGYEELIGKDVLIIRNLNAHLGDTVDLTKAVQANIDKLQDEASELQSEADALLKAQEDKIDEIVDGLNDEKDVMEETKNKLEEQLEILETQKDELEDIISNYEKIADIASDIVQSEIDNIEKSRQGIEDYYDSMIENIRSANEERQEAVNLAEKLAAYENAKNNKVKTYKEGAGWVYSTNKETVTNAREELLSAQRESEISRLEKEKEIAVSGYDDQIKALEEYSEQWGAVSEEITNAENEALAEQILGVGWREKIKSKDTEILIKYKNNYTSYKTQLNNLVNGEITDLNKSIKAKNDEIKAKEKQIESWKTYKTEIQKIAENIKTTWDTYLTGINEVKLNENSSYTERLTNLKNFKNNYAGIGQQIIDVNKKIAASNSLLDSLNEDADMNGDTAFIGSGVVTAGVGQIAQFASITSGLIDKIREMFKKLSTVFTGEAYASGGTNSRTGWAWLDGTNSSSETIFNAADSKKLYNLIHNTPDLTSKIAGDIMRNLNFSNQSNQVTNNNPLHFELKANFGDIKTDNPDDFSKRVFSCMDEYFRNALLQSYTNRPL